MTNYEKINKTVDIDKETFIEYYGVLEDGRIFKCTGKECCERCIFFSAEEGMCDYGAAAKWLDEEVNNETAKSETQMSRGEKVVLNTVREANGEKFLDTALMGIIAAALVDIKDALTKQNNSLTKEHK